jgi:multicomponent Na+:H+ antiporter subunit D
MLLHPGLWLVLAGLLVAFVRGPARTVIGAAVPALALALLWITPMGVGPALPFLDFELTPYRVDILSRLFATVFLLTTVAGAIFSARQDSRIELPAALVYAGAAVGAVLAADLISLFVWWEVMAVGSTLVIWAGGPRARASSMRYLMVHLFGGVLLMAGIAGHVAAGHGIAFSPMQPDGWAHGLILAGFLINAGAPPLWSWIADAYPRASWSGMVFLSAFTTKTAVYVLMRGFPGVEILIPVGMAMVFYGLFYAAVAGDMRRILAYAIVNQVGFMVVGVGIGSDLALNGVAAHAFAHIAYKALLLMTAGAVLYRTGRSHCVDLGGLWHGMRFTAVLALIGAMAAMALPLFSAFVTKSMMVSAAAEAHLLWVWLGLSVASACMVFNAGVRYPYYVFFAQDAGLRPEPAPASMKAGMLIMAAVCIGMGVLPGVLYAQLPYAVDYVPYTGSHVLHQLQTVLLGVLAFFLTRRFLAPTRDRLWDLDWLYRQLGEYLVRAAGKVVRGLQQGGMGGACWLVLGIGQRLRQHYGPTGVLARTWASGHMVLWVAILLLMYLLLFYLPG